MNLPQAENAIVNGIYAAIAWLIFDLGLLFQEHGKETASTLVSHPELVAGIVIVIACIGGLFYKSRLAATVLFLLILLPLVLRMIQGVFPSTIHFLFFLILLYFFLNAVLGSFNYHKMKTLNQRNDELD